MPSIADGFRLANGVTIPCVGLGTYQCPDNENLVQYLIQAIKLGYRHFDTAHIYNNEHAVGEAVKRCGLPREQLFITSKLWNADRGFNETLSAFDRTMQTLGLDYLDLYLIHWPAAKGEAMTWQSINSGTWRAMEEIYRSGRVRAIGVSNFLVHHLVPLLARAEIVPQVNQLEIHPGYLQRPTCEFCQQHGIQLVAWSPLGRGLLLKNPLVVEIAAKVGVTPARLLLRWSLQHGYVPLPKTGNPERLKENSELFDFHIDAEDMKRLDSMPQTCFSGLDPDHVTF